MRRTSVITFIIALTVAMAIQAAAPQLINYRGRLTDNLGTPVANGSYSVVFTIYVAAAAGSSVWTETQSVTTADGLFSVLLGSVNPILDTVFNAPTRYLGIAVAGDSEISPRTTLVSVAFAHRVNTVDGASGGIISGDMSIQSDLTVSGKAIIGPGHTSAGANAFVAGANNSAVFTLATVSGGEDNTASNLYTTVGGGGSNTASGFVATVGGGFRNTASGDYSTVGGGRRDTALGLNSTVSGGDRNVSRNNYATVGGGERNVASGNASAVGGGRGNFATGSSATVSGGSNNKARGNFSVVAGGGGSSAIDSNSALGDYSAIGGGRRNSAIGESATVSGGVNNSATVLEATVGGGAGNTASQGSATVGGGNSNTSSGFAATIAGGINNTAAGSYSFAAGRRAKANHNGAFVWGDGTNLDFVSTGSNQFLIRASGGVGIGTNNPSNALTVSGAANITGNLGIGTSNPGARLHVSTTSSTIAELTTSHSFSYVKFGHTGTGARKWALHTGAGNGTGKFAILDWTAGENRLAIDISGNVGIGTISPNYRLDVRGTIGNNTTLFHSDVRWKKNVETIRDALDKVKQLRGVKFEWKSEEFADMNFPEGKRLGFIAQEIEKVLPELVTTAADGYKSVEYANLVSVLIEATKEQQEQIDELKKIVAQLVSATQTDVTLSKK